MLRWLILVLVVVTLTAAATYWTLSVSEPEVRAVPKVVAPTGPQPRFEIVGPPDFNFGTMSQFDAGKHSWTIKNVGHADLEMHMARSSCSCTIAKLRRTTGQPAPTVVVKPGESTEIDLEWETRTFSGNYAKNAIIATNEADRPTFQLDIRGVVYPPVQTEPPEKIRFEAISNDEVNRGHIFVYSMNRPETKIAKLTTSRPEFFVARYAPLTAEERQEQHIAKGGYRVDVEIKPGLPPGAFQDELVIETDHPRQPNVKVSLAGRSMGPISVIPAALRLTDVSASKGLTTDLTLLVRGGRPTTFEIEHKPPQLEVTIEPASAQAQTGRYRLRVKVPPGTPPVAIDETMIIKTDHPGTRELKVPLYILISNAGG